VQGVGGSNPLAPTIFKQTFTKAFIFKMSFHSIIYLTCSDQNEAKELVTILLNKKLIACANIMQPHSSLYSWEGEIKENEETAVILKTKTSLFKEIEEKILELHSYDTPCIISLPIEKGHQPFLNWIDKSTNN
jgi:periplasmic divalent cation tolerance protein